MTSIEKLKSDTSLIRVFLDENKKKINYLIVFFLILIWGELQIFGYSVASGKILCITSIVLTTSLIIRAFVKKNIIFILLSVYIFLYTYVTKYIFFDYIPISFHESFGEAHFIYKSSLVHLLFLIVFNVFIKIPDKQENNQIEIKDNNFIFYLNFFIAIMAMILGRSGEMIFDSGGYGYGEVNQSVINEYFFIFYVIAFVFSGLRKNKIILLFILAGLYSIKNLLYGGRIEVVMLGLSMTILFFQFKISFKKFILLILVSIVFFNIYGIIRGNPLILLEEDWYSVIMPKEEESKDIIISQEGDVNHATSRMIGMADTNVIPFEERSRSFLYFLLSSFTPSSALPPIANLSSYKQDMYSVGGGGLISGYFYVFGSYIGVILIALFLSYNLSKIGNVNKHLLIQFYLIFLIITLPRWFGYNPVAIIKLSVYGALIAYFFYCIDYTYNKLIQKQL